MADSELPVIEIGPGRGALTEYLLPLASRVVAIEVDQVLVHYLQEKFRGDPKFSVISADVLKTDLASGVPSTSPEICHTTLRHPSSIASCGSVRCCGMPFLVQEKSRIAWPRPPDPATTAT